MANPLLRTLYPSLTAWNLFVWHVVLCSFFLRCCNMQVFLLCVICRVFAVVVVTCRVFVVVVVTCRFICCCCNMQVGLFKIPGLISCTNLLLRSRRCISPIQTFRWIVIKDLHQQNCFSSAGKILFSNQSKLKYWRVSIFYVELFFNLIQD